MVRKVVLHHGRPRTVRDRTRARLFASRSASYVERVLADVNSLGSGVRSSQMRNVWLYCWRSIRTELRWWRRATWRERREAFFHGGSGPNSGWGGGGPPL